MFFVGCSLSERFVNPLFEVFDGGDFILSSYRDIEEDFTSMRIYFAERGESAAARACLEAALALVCPDAQIEEGELPDEDWKFAYRRHFKTERIGRRLMTVPAWELATLENSEGRETVVLDPGMAFGTGKHETTRACLEYIEELSADAQTGGRAFLDMGCGSGILSIAAAKLGFQPVVAFDVDQEAVEASAENCAANGVSIDCRRFALGRGGAPAAAELPRPEGGYALVAANILGPLLIRFADEITPCCADRLIVSGILNELYPEVLAAYERRGFREESRRTLGEWTTGLLRRREAADSK